MDLKDLRNEIDDIDSELLSLFIKRMNVCRKVAEFKKQNDLPILQGGREEEIINRIKKMSPFGLSEGSAVLFTNIMDISKSIQQQEISNGFFLEPKSFIPSEAVKIGCQGVSGAYQEKAAKKLFPDCEIVFYRTYTEVFEAVENRSINFGVLPIQNSTAGSVAETYDLMRKYNFYIPSRIQIEINHCLAVKNETENIDTVYSHIQALSQCSDFLFKNGIIKKECGNTAEAAEIVAKSELKNIGAICSEECAKEYGLKIFHRNIADVKPNYTRFICLSKDFLIPNSPSVISISVSIPNVKGSLYRLLTKFSVAGLNMCHIESKPIQNGSFDVMFYIDFLGNIYDKKVSGLLNELKNELPYFKFIGNYSDLL